MSHKVIIEKVFSHPIASSIDWKKLSSTLKHFGAEIEVSHSNKARISMNGNVLSLSLPHHGHEIADKPEVTKLKHFLQEVDLTPDKI